MTAGLCRAACVGLYGVLLGCALPPLRPQLPFAQFIPTNGNRS
jgi:hypothetical protein